MSIGITVIKRNGDKDSLNLEKVHKMVEHACEGLAGVSASQVEISSGIQFFDGIKTSQIQEILVKSASDLISLDNPNYQYVASRLLLFDLRKQLNNHYEDHPFILDHVKKCADLDVYDKTIIEKYSEEEWKQIDSYIDYGRDYLFSYAGMRQVVDKYLVQDRSSGELYETPQQMYIMIAATLFQEYPQETRLDYVRRYYNAISKHKINIPTPVMAGVRTPLRQFASCVLVDVDDTLDSIFSSDMALATTLHKGRELVSTQVASVGSTAKSVVEKSNTQALYLSSKSLKALSDAALRMALEVDQQLSTSPSGTKK